jgi:isopenicillin N synthase-like dioxygenase
VPVAQSLATKRFSKQHTNFTHLPVVDIGGLYSPDERARAKTAAKLGDAARESGFCYIIGHRVPDVIVQRALEQSKLFFSLPLEEKMKVYIGLSKHHKGYVPEGEEVFSAGSKDRKEAFDLGLDLSPDDPDVLAGTPILGPNVWPDLQGFREAIGAYYDAVSILGNLLFRGFAQALELPESYFNQFVTKPPSQLRLIHYPHNPDAVDGSGIGAHTDYECFTILLPTAAGLEVMNGAGEWIDAPPVENAFVVNIGDMMEVWTNGEFVATSHRVRRVQEERYSFAMFCVCDYQTVVQPLPPFVSSDRPSQYESQVAGEHLFAQTAQSFTYLKKRLAAGDLVLPDSAKPLSSFGQEARHGAPMKEMA